MDPISGATAAPVSYTKQAGKSAMSVGHQAKAAVAEARAAGVELARNAQGFAASQIARGADAASVFAAQIAALTPVEPVTPPEGQVIDAYELGTGTPEETAAPDDTGTPVEAPTTPLDEALTPSEVATTLLDPLTEAEADA